jgi:NAD(P)-dependent dehydrogenase (short-subunit alcohol dehydrogenase family)
VLDAHGRIDLLFNNAGIGVGGAAIDFAQADWDDVLDVNVRGVVHGIQAVYPKMAARGSGHIVNTASMAGLVPTGNMASYTTSKHAVVGLSKALRIEGAAHGVKVAALCPGVIRTPILMGGTYGRHAGATRPSDEVMRRMFERMRPMDPHVFAREVLRDVEADRPYIIVPRWWKAIWLLERVAPSLSLGLWTRMQRRLTEELRTLADQEPAEIDAEAPTSAQA